MLCMLICFLLLPLSAFAVSVRIVQIWDDGNDINHLRPASVPVTVSSDEESLLVADDQIHELSGSNFSFLQAELPASYTSTSIIKEKNNLLTAVFINRHPVEMTPVYTFDTTVCHDWFFDLDASSGDTTAKFLSNHAWDVNWGDTAFPYGIGSSNGPNIPVTKGSYRVFFNDITGQYYFFAK